MVQRIRETGVKRRKPKSVEKNLFAGILYCADCDRKLHFNVNHPSTHIQYFNCSNYRGNRGLCNDTHYIRADALEQVILLEIRRMTAFLRSKEDEFVQLLMARSLTEAEKDGRRRKSELTAITNRIRELDALFTRTYEDNICQGVMSVHSKIYRKWLDTRLLPKIFCLTTTSLCISIHM
jgi:hypothetical protein